MGWGVLYPGVRGHLNKYVKVARGLCANSILLCVLCVCLCMYNVYVCTVHGSTYIFASPLLGIMAKCDRFLVVELALCNCFDDYF